MNNYLIFEIRIWLLLLLVLLLAGAAVGLWFWLRRKRRLREERIREEAIAEAERDALAKRNRMLIRLDHELKNPLTALRTSAATVREMSTEVVGAPVEMAPAVRQIDSSSRRVARLLADLRKLADVESRQLDYRRVDMDRLLHQAVEDARTAPGAEDRMIVATVARAPWKLPDVAGEEDLLLSAVLNVLGNALKYSTDADVVELRANEQVIDGFRWVVVEIADTGSGIPAQEQESVWDELSRGSRVRSVAGSGMGLSLVKAIISRHGGTVELFSQEGAGTSVRILLPVLADAPGGERPSGEAVAPPRRHQDAQRAGRILGTPRRTSKRRLQMVDGQLRDMTTGEAFGNGSQPAAEQLPPIGGAPAGSAPAQYGSAPPRGSGAPVGGFPSPRGPQGEDAGAYRPGPTGQPGPYAGQHGAWPAQPPPGPQGSGPGQSQHPRGSQPGPGTHR